MKLPNRIDYHNWKHVIVLHMCVYVIVWFSAIFPYLVSEFSQQYKGRAQVCGEISPMTHGWLFSSQSSTYIDTNADDNLYERTNVYFHDRFLVRLEYTSGLDQVLILGMVVLVIMSALSLLLVACLYGWLKFKKPFYLWFWLQCFASALFFLFFIVLPSFVLLPTYVSFSEPWTFVGECGGE